MVEYGIILQIYRIMTAIGFNIEAQSLKISCKIIFMPFFAYDISKFLSFLS